VYQHAVTTYVLDCRCDIFGFFVLAAKQSPELFGICVVDCERFGEPVFIVCHFAGVGFLFQLLVCHCLFGVDFVEVAQQAGPVKGGGEWYCSPIWSCAELVHGLRDCGVGSKCHCMGDMAVHFNLFFTVFTLVSKFVVAPMFWASNKSDVPVTPLLGHVGNQHDSFFWGVVGVAVYGVYTFLYE
jgi:hypothetical protein